MTMFDLIHFSIFRKFNRQKFSKSKCDVCEILQPSEIENEYYNHFANKTVI